MFVVAEDRARKKLGNQWDMLNADEQFTAVEMELENMHGAVGFDENLGAPLDSDEEMDAQAEALDQAEEQVVQHGPIMQRISFDYVPDANKHRYGLRAEVARPADRNVVAMHLLQTDHNVQPVMGRVHLVKPDFGYSDRHFMHDVEGDINEGQKAIVERGRRGPFRDQTGASTIMDRSAHIMYRKRDGVFEITVRRGVLETELQQMLSKLSMHRTHQGGSRVTIIKGSRRYRMGDLAQINLSNLKDMVAECVDQYGVCGLEVVEQVPGSGPLYKDGMHSASFKARTRRKKGAVHGSRRR